MYNIANKLDISSTYVFVVHLLPTFTTYIYYQTHLLHLLPTFTTFATYIYYLHLLPTFATYVANVQYC